MYSLCVAGLHFSFKLVVGGGGKGMEEENFVTLVASLGVYERKKK